MSARRLSDAHFVAIALAITLLLAGGAAMLEAPSRGGAGGASSFSAAPGGTKAAFTTLKQLGYTIERSYEPLASLRADPARTTLLLTGRLPPSDQDRRAWMRFVEAGGIALVVGAAGADLLRVSGAAPAFMAPTPGEHRALAPSPLTWKTKGITMTPLGGAPKFGPTYARLFAVSDDEPLVTTARIGGGRVVWWASAEPMTNLYLSRASNLQLLLNLAGVPGERALLWDEHYHGHSRSLWSYASGTPLPWVAAQASVMALAVLVTFSRRRGPIRARASDVRTSPLEFIDMLRSMYQRGGAAGAAAAAGRTRLRRLAVSVCGIPADSSDDLFAHAVAANTGMPAGAVAAIMASGDRVLRDPADRSKSALQAVQGYQRLVGLLTTQRRPGETRKIS